MYSSRDTPPRHAFLLDAQAHHRVGAAQRRVEIVGQGRRKLVQPAQPRRAVRTGTRRAPAPVSVQTLDLATREWRDVADDRDLAAAQVIRPRNADAE